MNSLSLCQQLHHSSDSDSIQINYRWVAIQTQRYYFHLSTKTSQEQDWILEVWTTQSFLSQKFDMNQTEAVIFTIDLKSNMTWAMIFDQLAVNSSQTILDLELRISLLYL